jgi:CPA1 family monovalent cation:H+ antiporter
MSEQTREATHAVWEFLGYLANSLLFLLVGVQMGESRLFLTVGGIGLALAGVIIGRATMIYTLLPLHDVFAYWMNSTKIAGLFSWLPHPKPLPPSWRPILLLSGLRGALSIALVLGLPDTLQERGLLENIVYGVVLVTLLGQGIGLHILLPHWNKDAHEH